MELGNLPPPPPDEEAGGELEAPLETPDAPRQSGFNRLRTYAAVGVSATVLAFVGIRAALELSADDSHQTPGAKVGRQNYAPIAEIDDSSPTKEATSETLYEEYMSEGHSTGLFPPSDKSRAAYKFFVGNSHVGKADSPPPLREVSYLQDQKLFRPEYKDHLNIYPFSIYNATEHPVDLVFLNYAIRATKVWLSDNVQQDEGFVIGGHTETKVQSTRVPHTLVLTDTIPPELRKDFPGINGITTTYPDATGSIIRDSGTAEHPFEPWLVGTEVCQSLVDVYDEKTVPGQADEQQDVRDFVSSFNLTEEASENLDLTTQEILCNALGRTVAAAYMGGLEAVKRLPAEEGYRVGETNTPWLDFAPFQPQIDNFIRLSRHARSGDITVITVKGDESPTARYYEDAQQATS